MISQPKNDPITGGQVAFTEESFHCFQIRNHDFGSTSSRRIILDHMTSNWLGGVKLMVHSTHGRQIELLWCRIPHIYTKQCISLVNKKFKNNAIRLNFYGVRNPILGNHKSISYCVVVYHYFVCHGFLQGVWYGAQPRCRQYTVVYVYYLVFFGARPWCMWATRCTLV